MKAKELIAVAGVLVVLGFAYNYASGARADAVAAEERVHVLEAERMDLERQVEEATQGYELLVDSLAEAHDSIAEVRARAVERASSASRSFDEGVGVLRDSLEAYDGLGAILDEIQADHRDEVQAYQEQVETLEADKVLLWQRVEALDSMWVTEQRVNDALRREITALNEESDAWKSLAIPGIMSRVGRAVPYVVAGIGIGTLLARS
jgi:chromosome segregation ATPase